ncbi:MAG TPA: efflux RND transporter permease subunit [Kofleriaceae bacterium]|nr:efflux RND transporter permease subunit [Kofleriaceae bacterium]
MKIAEISIRRPVFAMVLIGVFIVLGLFSYPRVGVDLFPNVDFPFVTVTVTYPGADPASMESKVADPIEEAVNTMSGIKVLRSVNVESVSQVFIQFDLEVDVDQATQDVRDRVSSILSILPEGIDPPKVQKLDVGSAPIMSVALSGKLEPRELTRLADDVVKDRIQRINGVGAVELIGGREREIHVLIRPDDLTGLGYTVEDVARALQSQNLEMPAGRIEQGTRELTVKTRGEVRTVQEIRDIILPALPASPVQPGVQGAIVRLAQVADVQDSAEEARSWSSMDGTAAVALTVRKQSGANTVAIAKQVRAEVAQMQAQLEKEGAKVSIPSDWSGYIEHSINDVKFDLFFGAILAVVIILFFLHDVRSTLISAVAIPSSVVATFWFIDFMDFTFNNMTMLALSLSVGILIDDAIVVIENIYRHLARGKRAEAAANDATSEIGLAVLATTASLIAVFLPVAFMKGIVGRFFYQFGLTVSFAVAVSALVSFTVTPMLASRLLRPHEEGHRPFVVFRPFAWFLDRIDRSYHGVLGWSLRHRWKTLGIALLAMIGSCALVSRVPQEFIPPEDRAEFEVNVELPIGSSLGLTTRYIETVADDLRKNAPGVAHTFVTVGGGEQGQVNQGKIAVQLTPRKERPFHQTDIMNWVRDRYGDVESAVFSVAPINAVSGGGFRSQQIQFNIRGRDLDELARAADALVAELEKDPGFVDVDSTHRAGRPELAVDVNRERAADLGVPVAAVATTLRALIAGDKVSELKEGLDIYDVTMALPEQLKSGFQSLDNLKVRSASGQLVDLANVVEVVPESGPAAIERQARQRQITVLTNLKDMPLGEGAARTVAAARKVVPGHLTTDFAGMAEVMQESFQYMGVALLLAVVFVYMLLAAQFNSFVHPFTIMLSLPLSVIGAFGALFISGMSLSIFSMIGVIMLMGLVTKNAILLVDYTNTLRGRGLPVREALLEAGPVRLRPILMTTAAMVFGMLPVALALSEGGETRAPMAVTVIGGLLTSMLLTLVVVPVVYSLLAQATQSRPVRAVARRVFPASGEGQR